MSDDTGDNDEKKRPHGQGRDFKRSGGGRDFKKREDRPFKPRGDKPHWKKRPPGEGRDFKRDGGDRPRPFKARDDKPHWKKREEGDRPRRFESSGDKPHWKKRDEGDRPRRFESSGDKPHWKKREEGDRPRRFESSGDKPHWKKRDEGDRPRRFESSGDKPHWKKREEGDRPRRFESSGDKPHWKKRDEGDRPRRFESSGDKPHWKKRDEGDRPRRFESSGDKPHWKKREPERADDLIHQRDLVRVAGSKAVKALFAGAPERVERLFFLPEMKDEVGGYCRILAHGRKIFRETPADELERIAGSAMHGGIVAVARPKPVPPLDLDETRRWAKDTPLLPILHGVGNPHNFGAIARTAAFLGLPRLVISDHPAQAGLSDAAFRIAEGGFECLELYRATDFAQTLRQLRETFRVVGAAVGRGTSPDRIPRDKPIALVLGNEETGLDATTLAACDEAVTIQGTGAIQSLNVSVAAGVLLYALRPAPGTK